MVLVDTALAKRARENNPIRVGMIGAGFMGKIIALQLLQYVRGVSLVAIYNRSIAAAQQAFEDAAISSYETVSTQTNLEARIGQGAYSVVDDPMLICRAENIDVIIEVTGAVEFSSHVVMEAIRNKKHVVLMNAELDATIGPILKTYADEAGVILTNCDGDQPGVQMNLFRFVKSIGVRPVLCGNIKGLQDAHRNPDTQKDFAAKWGQKPIMVSSFADGTKMSFEQAVVANATGMAVAKRGMYGFSAHGLPLKEAIKKYPVDVLTAGPGIVDYLVGAEPVPGIFVLGTHDDPQQQHYLNRYKLDEGLLYLFYTPYHLCHFEIAFTCARAVLFNDATITPLGRPYVDVVATAKRDLREGEVIDSIGGYLTYGQCENALISHEQQLLPMGLAEGCTLTRNIACDEVISYHDVIVPPGRYADQLREEQNKHFYVSDYSALHYR
ncbi:MAG TPA: Gfo/Idh/MocA family oxidoreductase [Cyclobacteriaceae bacterium]|jgi:predicted homoserine dehydrogenase-like protein|nr:Gfo/Idh/MocA family oxidoreductase [Cyclobacteriaceae bacterium]